MLSPPAFLRAALFTAGLVFGASVPGGAQDGTVSGTVVESGTQRPIDGAEVTFAGTNRRSRTDALGRFSFADLGASELTLEVKSLGYRPRTLRVHAGGRAIELSLTRAAVMLDELVVTGTAGATESRAVGNAVARISAAEILKAAPVADVHQLLNARAPGVVVIPYSGNVGTGAAVRVRGATSLSLGNDPLIYVDGARADNNAAAGPNIRGGRQASRLNDINPEDIESIEILKGPAAATLYGTEASRGVVQILTKQGSPGPPTFSAVVKQGANWFMNPAGRIRWNYGRDPATGALDSMNLYLQEEAAGRPMFRTGHPQAYGLSVSGGTESARYYLSGDFDRDEGYLSYNWRNRFSTRANVTVLPNERLEVRASLSFARNKARLAQAAEFWDLWTQIVLGSLLTRDTPLRGFFRATPEAAAQIETYDQSDRVIASVQFRHQPWHWLTHRLTVGSDAGAAVNSVLYPRDPLGDFGPFGGLSLGDKTVERLDTRYETFDYSISASAALPASLEATTSLGAQYYTKQAIENTLRGTGFPTAGVNEIAGAALTRASERSVENKTVGVFVQEAIGWRNRVFLTGALRADDNSAFGADFDYVIYPKVSASWVLTEESASRSQGRPLLNTLKLRAAWGGAGQQPDAFAAERSYRPIPGPGDIPVLMTQNLGNDSLKPERSEELEAGFDAGLFRDRVSIGFTYYRQVTTDGIVARQAAPSGGFIGTQFVNLGRVRNWGTELSLDARMLSRQALAWELGLTLGTNRSHIESLGGLPPITVSSLVGPSAVQFHKEGYPVAAFFGREIVDPGRVAGGTIVGVLCADTAGSRQPVPCDRAPAILKGPAMPRWEGTVRTSVTVLGALRLSALVDFRGGHMANNAEGRNVNVLNSKSANDSSDAFQLAYADLFRRGVMDRAEAELVKAGFAKLREIALVYELPRGVAAKLGASSGTVSVSARNLAILWRAQKSTFGDPIVDPENRNSNQSNLSGFQRFSLPQAAQLMTTVRLAF